MVAVYFIPLALLFDIKNGDFLSAAKDFLIISYPRYWFFRDYLFLFLFSPVINLFLKDATPRQRVYLIIILAFIAIWVGTSGGCGALHEGKNLTNFMLLYGIGNTLKVYRENWEKIPSRFLIISFLILNAVVLFLWMINSNNIIGKVIWMISFPYCSPLLYVNAILLFMMIGKLRFQSKTVNWIAASAFAVYLIHYHPIVFNNLIKPVSDYILAFCNNTPSEVIPLFFLFAIVIFCICILVDKMLQPLWTFVVNKCNIIDVKINERNV